MRIPFYNNPTRNSHKNRTKFWGANQSAGVPAIRKKGSVSGRRAGVQGPQRLVPRVDRLGCRAKNSGSIYIRFVVYQCRQSQLYSRGRAGLRGQFENQSQNRVLRRHSQGRPIGIANSHSRPQENRTRRQNAMVFHQERSDSECRPQGANRNFMEDTRRRFAVQSISEQSNTLGCESSCKGISSTLERHGVLPSGRETGIGDGRLSASKRPRPDQAHVHGFRGVQYAYSPTGFIPFEWLGTYKAEDHRRSLRSGDERKPLPNDTMDIRSHSK